MIACKSTNDRILPISNSLVSVDYASFMKLPSTRVNIIICVLVDDLNYYATNVIIPTRSADSIFNKDEVIWDCPTYRTDPIVNTT